MALSDTRAVRKTGSRSSAVQGDEHWRNLVGDLIKLLWIMRCVEDDVTSGMRLLDAADN